MTVEFKLETALTLCEHLGNPQDNIPYYIHVGGISGKTSTVCYLHRLLNRCAPELRIGSFIYPYIFSPRECIRIGDATTIEEGTFGELTRHVSKMDEIFGTRCTFYERLFMVALLAFKEARCDLIIVESALGGTFDATNVLGKLDSPCRPLAVLLTTVGLDHTRYLGEDLGCIVANILGLQRPQTPLLVAQDQPEAFAEALQSFQVKLAEPASPYGVLAVEEFVSGMPPHQQANNIDLALRALQLIGPRLEALLRTKVHRPALGSLSDVAISHSFAQFYYRGRLLIVDSAQNAISPLNSWVRSLPPAPAGKSIHIVMGMKRKQGSVNRDFLYSLGCRADYRFSFVCFAAHAEYPVVEVAPRELLIELVNELYAEQGAARPPNITPHVELPEVLAADLEADQLVIVCGSHQIASSFYHLCMA